jgi:NADPH:quinone reductase-like Zn-dependent oxidoreductase
LDFEIEIIKISKTTKRTDGLLPLVDWSSPVDLDIKIQPASLEVNLSASKTYLLIGMTGDLGRSVAQWMISKGARYIVLTSRNPKVDEWWIESMARHGAKIFPMPM